MTTANAASFLTTWKEAGIVTTSETEKRGKKERNHVMREGFRVSVRLFLMMCFMIYETM